MGHIIEFFKAHWIWIVAAAVGLWIGFKLFLSSPSSSAAVVSPATAVSTSDPNADALQAMQVQAQSTVASQQIAAGQAISVAQIAQQIDSQDKQYGLAVTNLNDNASVAINTSNNQAAIVGSNNLLTSTLASIAAAFGLGKVQSDNQVIMNQSNNATIVSVNSTNDAYSYAGLVNTNASDLAAALDTNAASVAETANTNATELSAYGIQASVASQQIAAQQQVLDQSRNDQNQEINQQLALQAQVQNNAITAQSAALQGVLGEITYGKLGVGTNGVAAIAAVEGAPAAAANAAAATAVSANSSNSSPAAIISSLSGFVASASKGAAKGAALLLA
jgi:hypothetical protein